jgi:hypothetical protein
MKLNCGSPSLINSLDLKHGVEKEASEKASFVLDCFRSKAAERVDGEDLLKYELEQRLIALLDTHVQKEHTHTSEEMIEALIAAAFVVSKLHSAVDFAKSHAPKNHVSVCATVREVWVVHSVRFVL